MNTPNTLKQHLNNATVIASIILGFAFISGLWIYGQRPSTDEVITITGSAKETVVSDLATYNASLDKTYPVSMGLPKMLEDFNKKSGVITGYLKYKGIKPEQIKMGISLCKKYMK